MRKTKILQIVQIVQKMKRSLKVLLCLAIILSQGLGFPVYARSIAKDADKETKETKEMKQNEYVVFTEKNIKTEDMRKKSKLDKDKLEEYMKKFPSLSGIEDTLLEMQDEYNVNAILIFAIVRLESGNGKSQIAKSKNNLGGIITYEKSARVYKSFDSRSDCVIYMAKLLSENYLTEGGRYYNGYTLPDIAKKYSAAPDKWSDYVSELIYEIQTSINAIKI